MSAMEMDSLQQLEERITELTERFLELKEGHQKVLSELALKNSQIEELNDKMKDYQQTKVEVHSKIENILKKLEYLKTQPEE